MFHGLYNDDDDDVVTPKTLPPVFDEEIKAPQTPSVRQLAASSPLPPPLDGEVEEMTLPSTPIPSIIPLPLGNTEANRKDMGSAGRYGERLQAFQRDGAPLPWVRHYFFWLLHNLVAHPILGVLPSEKTVDFHDLTSAWLNKEEPRLQTPVPNIRDDRAWLLHNLVAHVAIGLLPCKWTFQFHDWTARRMRVPGWV